jgi:hypothetical protein
MIMTTGHAIGIALLDRFRRNEPIADALFGIDAETVMRTLVSGVDPIIALRIERDEPILSREITEFSAAFFAFHIFKKQELRAALAFEETHVRTSQDLWSLKERPGESRVFAPRSWVGTMR